jgi:protocatechuate 3,4-dioxygenase beta subunit
MTSAPPTEQPAVPTFEGRPFHDPSEPLFDQGLAFDVETLLSRRSMLKAIGFGGVTAGLVTLAGCSPSGSRSTGPGGTAAGATASTAARAGSSAATADCTIIPEETAGPFPGDGSNGPDVLTQSGVVRSDIRSSFGTSTTTAKGVPLTIRFALLDGSKDCAPLANAAVYAWHCDQDGNYSMYSQGVTNENYLRGVQAAGADGVVTFTSIFPACYQGRWPHVHFEVYPSLDKATSPANRIATSQIALPADICQQVYATDGYATSLTTFPQVSLQTDMVFRDDAAIHQIGAMSGTTDSGLTVELPVPVQTA